MVYETNPVNPNQYRYQGNWEDMEIIEEVIEVKGTASVTVELKYTRHGPVSFEDSDKKLSLCDTTSLDGCWWSPLSCITAYGPGEDVGRV